MLIILILGLLASLAGGAVCLRLAYRLLVQGLHRWVHGYGELSESQRIAARVPHGILMLTVGLWYVALPFAAVALQLPVRLLGPLIMVGVGIGLVGQGIVRRVIRRAAV